MSLGADASRIHGAIDAARSARDSAGLDPAEVSFGAYVNVGCHDDVGQAREIVKGQVGSFAQFTGMSNANSKGLEDEKTFRHIGANYDMANHGLAAGRHLQAVPDDFISRFRLSIVVSSRNGVISRYSSGSARVEPVPSGVRPRPPRDGRA